MASEEMQKLWTSLKRRIVKTGARVESKGKKAA
jgi:hypothetical protein